MKYYRLFMCMFILALFAAQAYADDDWMNPSDSGTNAAARQDIKNTMGGEDIFNTNPHAGATGTAKATVMISKNTKLPEKSASTPASVTGSMALILTDSMQRSVNVALIQSGDAVFGRGSMASGDVTQDIAAIGSVSGNKLNIDLLSMNDVNLFRLSIDINGKSLSGSYNAFSAGSTWTGSVAGSMA